jgi:hypothetical protein
MTDFSEDVAALLGHEVARGPRTPERPAGAGVVEFFAGILPAGVEPPVDPLGHPCCRCSATADLEEQRGRPRPPIAQAERKVGENGRVYWLGTCARCTDLEFSMRWNLRRTQTKNEGEITALDRQLQRWRARGRRFFG